MVTAPEQLRGARVAFNGDDSLSGWVMPRHALRGLGIDPDGYDWVRTGSHRNSLARAAARRGRGGADRLHGAAPWSCGRIRRSRRSRRIARLGRMPSPPVALVGGDAALPESLRAALRD